MQFQELSVQRSLSVIVAILLSFVAAMCAEGVDDYFDRITPDTSIVSAKCFMLPVQYDRIAHSGSMLFAYSSVVKAKVKKLSTINGAIESLDYDSLYHVNGIVLMETNDEIIAYVEGNPHIVPKPFSFSLSHSFWTASKKGVWVQQPSEDVKSTLQDPFSLPRPKETVFIGFDGAQPRKIGLKAAGILYYWSEVSLLVEYLDFRINFSAMDSEGQAKTVGTVRVGNDWLINPSIPRRPSSTSTILTYPQNSDSDGNLSYIIFNDEKRFSVQSAFIGAEGSVVDNVVAEDTAVVLMDSGLLRAYELTDNKSLWDGQFMYYRGGLSFSFAIPKGDFVYVVRNEGVYKVSRVDGSFDGFLSYSRKEDSGALDIDMKLLIRDAIVLDNRLIVLRMDLFSGHKSSFIYVWELDPEGKP